MIYQLTERGKKLWPEHDLVIPTEGTFAISAVNRKTNFNYWIARNPQDIESLIRLGLIEDITKILWCKVDGCTERATDTYAGMPLCNRHCPATLS